MKQLFTAFLVCITCCTFAARHTVRFQADSAIKLLANPMPDSSKARLLIFISTQYYRINPDSGILFGGWAKKLCETNKFTADLARACHCLGLNHEVKTQNSEALDYYFQALNLFEKLGNSRSMAQTLGNIGNVYTSIARFDKALEFDSSALSVSERIKDTDGQLRNMGNMALVYQYMNNYPKAHQYFAMAMDMATKYDRPEELAKNLGNLSALNYEEKNIKSAIEYCKKAISIYRETDDEKGLASNLGNMGEYYMALAEDSGMKNSNARKTAMLTKAIGYLNEGILLSRRIQFYEGLIGCYQTIGKVYELLGNYKQALLSNREYFQLKDSVYSTGLALKIADLEDKRQKELVKSKQELLESEKRNIELRKTNERFVYIAGIILLLTIMGIVVRNFVNQIKSNRQLAKEKTRHLEKIKVQSSVLMDIAYIQSHEVRGPVSTILGLAQLFNYEDLSDPVNKELMEGISTLAVRLDGIVTDVVNKENSLLKDDDLDKAE